MKSILAVLYSGEGDPEVLKALAIRLNLAYFSCIGELPGSVLICLSFRNNALVLLDQNLFKKGGLCVQIEHRPGEQRSWPIAKNSPLAQAVGKKTKRILDVTCGWGQDSLALFRMGYQVICLERSAVMHALLENGFQRLSEMDWVRQLQPILPELIHTDSIDYLSNACLPQVDCIYIDPMFPEKKKKSALAKKPMTLLRTVLGDDLDKNQLFVAAQNSECKRLVIKCPHDAPLVLSGVEFSVKSKLVRYDVYIQ